MSYLELRNQLNSFIVFSLTDIRKIEPAFSGRRLNEWQGKGYIKMIRRGYYIFSDTELTEETLFLVANRLYGPSYVSLETALNYYGLVPEGVYSIISVTTKKTQQFNSLASFNYRHLKPGLFIGYRLAKVAGQNYKIAEIEKAVLDYLYLNSNMSNPNSLAEWRFNADVFKERANLDKFYMYLSIFDSPTLNSRVKQFVKFVEASNA